MVHTNSAFGTLITVRCSAQFTYIMSIVVLRSVIILRSYTAGILSCSYTVGALSCSGHEIAGMDYD